MRFKELQNSKFSGCTLLHQGVDPHRNRPAKYYALPGEFGLLGYSDDTDTFIIPVSVYVPRQATEALNAIREGRYVARHVPVDTAQRPTRQRRVFNDDLEPAPVVSRRRVFHD